MISWSLVASFQALVKGRGSFWACSLLLGLAEGGFIPDAILYLSYFYTSKELPMRVTYIYIAAQATFIVAAFLAYGILHMRGVSSSSSISPHLDSF
jgi:MFS family permease